LTELHIDGLVHISNLANDYYQFDPVGQRLIGESFGQIYRLGDAVKVKVQSVNLEERHIDFDLVETSRKQRGAGKTAKKRAAEGQSPAKAKGKKRAAKPQRARTYVEPTKAPDGQTEKKPKKSKAEKARKKKARSKSNKRSTSKG
jgi:ribonuclease R